MWKLTKALLGVLVFLISIIRSPSKYGISFIAHEVQVLEAQEHKVQVKDSHERKGGHDKNKDQGKPVSK